MAINPAASRVAGQVLVIRRVRKSLLVMNFGVELRP